MPILFSWCPYRCPSVEDEEVIEKILKHLGLWDLKVRPPPKVKAPSVTISIDDSDSQVPFSAPPFYPDPNYPMDSYLSWWGY